MQELMSLKDVSRLLGISTYTVYGLIKSNKLKHIRIGGKYKFNEECLTEFIKNNTVATN